MRSRLSRGNAARGGFKVDSLLGRKEVEVAASGGMSNGFNKGFMTLTFLGYYDKRRERPLERVACEIFLSKMAHKKRKESSSPMVFISLYRFYLSYFACLLANLHNVHLYVPKFNDFFTLV